MAETPISESISSSVSVDSSSQSSENGLAVSNESTNKLDAQPNGKKMSRADRKREKKKRYKKRRREQRSAKRNANLDLSDDKNAMEDGPASDDSLDEDIEVEYITEEPDLSDPMYLYFMKVFETYKIGLNLNFMQILQLSAPEDIVKEEERREEFEKWNRERLAPKAAIVERIVQDVEEAKQAKLREDAEKPRLSKKKLRLLMRPSIGELKASTKRPDVVEWHDVTAKDPKLLVHLKSAKNTVPVPRHWCFKRKYLAGKRGFEKPPFELPEFIRRTGIMEMRQSLQEKTKMRERIRPKMGKIDIDYQKLHDAFFRWQTKPRMTMVGDLYFEGKEFETRLREKKPGELSDEMRIALGMPVGPNAHRYPPPWLIAMQRYGPPPSYPNLKIPGLNAPIPDGCAFGYHAGGWGKPPVDETGRPLYGDVFGVDLPYPGNMPEEEEVETRHWGEMESEEESSEEESESEAEANEDEDNLPAPVVEGLITPSGISTGVSGGVETPDTIELRKKKLLEEAEGEVPSLYSVLPEKKVERISGQMMGSTHVYDVSAAMSLRKDTKSDGGIEVSLNPDELDLADASGLQQKYEEGLKQLSKDDDFSDLVAEHAARQKRRRKAQEEKKSSSGSKKYKDFKF
ncbi:hypothetical protein M514_09162 [Trichuris suis]|uniref:PSP proline-rich domain-containing protein n=1 Tax=Trichuris suis TaxID=68888 RepID=A0A085LYA2_9BILA|nr:hypothetical protein M513_09162 [Trichuris suis]KFD62704.1 hypothetical protein M514_09162 [Trichuris suis]